MLDRQGCLEHEISGLVEVSDLLEPCEGRLSSTVLRGEGRSDTTLLPDTNGGCKISGASAVKQIPASLFPVALPVTIEPQSA